MNKVAQQRREREKVIIRRKILDNAILIARTEGWPSLSIRKLATSIEYTTPVIYEHFATKEDLLTALSSEGFSLYQEICEQLAEQEKKPVSLLEQLTLAMLRFAHQQTEYYQVMFNLEGVVCRNEKSLNASFIKSIISQIAPQAEPDLLFLNWWALVYGFVNISLIDLKSLELSYKEQMLLGFLRRFISSI